MIALIYCLSSVSPGDGILETSRLASEAYKEHRAAGLANPGPWYLLPGIVCMTSFGCWAMPQMVHKFYTVNDERMILRGAIVCTLFALLIGFAAYYTGSLSHLFFDRLPDTGFRPLRRRYALCRKCCWTSPGPLLGSCWCCFCRILSTLSGLVLVSVRCYIVFIKEFGRESIAPRVDNIDAFSVRRCLSLFSYLIATHRITFY